MLVSKALKEAHTLALKHLDCSHSPYSGLKVAAVVQLKQGAIVGVNVENASYGATLCAERSALVSAVSQFGAPLDMDFILVISSFPGPEPIPPCGMCLQVLEELGRPDLPVYLGNQKEVKRQTTLAALLPQAFGRQSLPPQP